ncbi:MAG: carbohydrate ABC transporter permease [Bacillota bacterium]
MATAPQPSGPKTATRHRGLTLHQKRTLWAWGALAVPLAFFVIVRMAPTLYAMHISLYDWQILADEQTWIGLANYKQLFQDKVFWQSLKNTFVYVLVGVPAQITIGLSVALLIQRLNKFQGVFRMLYFIPYVTSSVAVAWVWRWIMQEHGGLFNQILLGLGFPAQKLLGSPDQAIYVIIAAIVWQGLGFSMVIFLAGLEAIPQTFYEAAEIDGANGWKRFWHITFPLLNPTIVFSALMGTIRYLQVFTEVLNMSSQGAGGPLNSTKTLVLFIYEEAFKSFNLSYASATTVVLFVIILVLTIVQSKVITRKFEY